MTVPSSATPPGTVLVTGAAGAVGSPLCERLLERGHRVVALDDLSTGDAANLQHLGRHPQFQFLRHDVTLPLPPQVRDATRIYNLACPGTPGYRRRHPVATMLASTLGTWRLLELAWVSGARLLQVSGCGVYGDPQVHPQPEDYRGHVDATAARASHEEGQRAAEAMACAYVRERGVGVRIARLFGVYGPRLRADDDRMLPTFISQALAGQPLTVNGSGLQTRTLCWVDDAVAALIRLMDSDISGPVNIGSEQERTVLEIAERVLALTGSASRIEHRALPAGDALRRGPDISVARQALGWQPQTTLDDGLARTIAAFRARDAAPKPAQPAARTRSAALRELAPVSRW